MSGYWVSTDASEPSWWVGWQLPGYKENARRPATPEEAAIMAKIEWSTDSYPDRDRLKALLRSHVAVQSPEKEERR